MTTPDEHDADEDSVVRANERFYEALAKLNIEEMDRVWAHGDDCRCIHPGWDLLRGWPSIRESWEAIFISSPGLRVEASDVHAMVHGSMAWVQCMERISNPGEEDEQVNLARVTNIFVREAGGWKLILHHASAIATVVDVETAGIVH